jgi:proline racemase
LGYRYHFVVWVSRRVQSPVAHGRAFASRTGGGEEGAAHKDFDLNTLGKTQNRRHASDEARDGELAVGERFLHRSILDTEFECYIRETTRAESVDAIVPEISGRAWLTGISHYGVTPDDPFPNGYRLGDTWFR